MLKRSLLLEEFQQTRLVLEIKVLCSYNLKNTSNAVTWMAQDPEVVGSVLMSNGKHDEAANIENALEKLSPEHREAILLREVQGLEYKEIANIMDCSLGTVMSRLFYARKKLQTLLINI